MRALAAATGIGLRVVQITVQNMLVAGEVVRCGFIRDGAANRPALLVEISPIDLPEATAHGDLIQAIGTWLRGPPQPAPADLVDRGEHQVQNEGSSQ